MSVPSGQFGGKVNHCTVGNKPSRIPPSLSRCHPLGRGSTAAIYPKIHISSPVWVALQHTMPRHTLPVIRAFCGIMQASW